MDGTEEILSAAVGLTKGLRKAKAAVQTLAEHLDDILTLAEGLLFLPSHTGGRASSQQTLGSSSSLLTPEAQAGSSQSDGAERDRQTTQGSAPAVDTEPRFRFTSHCHYDPASARKRARKRARKHLDPPKQKKRKAAKAASAARPARSPKPDCDRADALAKVVLERTRSSGSKVGDQDVLQVLEAWAFERNCKRKQVLPVGVKQILSNLFGLVRTRIANRLQVAKKTAAHPHVTLLLAKLLEDNPPAGSPAGSRFPFTTICVNKDYAARRHRDKANVGLSVIRALGAFSGGELRHWPADDRQQDLSSLQKSDAQVVSVQGSSQVIDSTRAHEVKNFQGARISLVYFCVAAYEEADEEVREELESKCGIRIVPLDSARRVWAPFAARLRHMRAAGVPGGADR